MDIIPAIDIRDGKCVRLIQGSYDRQITYDDDVSSPARSFAQAGARFVHIVDLDGAKSGRSENARAIEKIVRSVDMVTEIGGGIRDEQTIEKMFDIGIDRVIIGTAAVKDFDWFSRMTHKYPNRLVLGLDAKGARLAIQGWTEQSDITVIDFARRASELPIAAIIYTDISKDGMMSGPNIQSTCELADAVDVDVIASGGVTEIEDILRLKEKTSVSGAIIGRAIYEGRIDLGRAIEAAKS